MKYPILILSVLVAGNFVKSKLILYDYDKELNTNERISAESNTSKLLPRKVDHLEAEAMNITVVSQKSNFSSEYIFWDSGTLETTNSSQIKSLYVIDSFAVEFKESSIPPFTGNLLIIRAGHLKIHEDAFRLARNISFIKLQAEAFLFSPNVLKWVKSLLEAIVIAGTGFNSFDQLDLSGMENLKSMIVEESLLEEIPEDFCLGCDSLGVVKFWNSNRLSHVHRNAFKYLSKLISVTLEADFIVSLDLFLPNSGPFRLEVLNNFNLTSLDIHFEERNPLAITVQAIPESLNISNADVFLILGSNDPISNQELKQVLEMENLLGLKTSSLREDDPFGAFETSSVEYLSFGSSNFYKLAFFELFDKLPKLKTFEMINNSLSCLDLARKLPIYPVNFNLDELDPKRVVFFYNNRSIECLS